MPHTDASPYLNLLCESIKLPLRHPSFIIPDTKIEFYLSDHVLEIKNYSPLFCEIYAYQNIIVLEINN